MTTIIPSNEAAAESADASTIQPPGQTRQTCEGCGIEAFDVLARSVIDPENPRHVPHLCTACCAMYPGREWMRHGDATLPPTEVQ